MVDLIHDTNAQDMAPVELSPEPRRFCVGKLIFALVVYGVEKDTRHGRRHPVLPPSAEDRSVCESVLILLGRSGLPCLREAWGGPLPYVSGVVLLFLMLFSSVSPQLICPILQIRW